MLLSNEVITKLKISPMLPGFTVKNKNGKATKIAN